MRCGLYAFRCQTSRSLCFPPSAEARVGCVSKCPSPSTLLHTRTLISFSLVLPILLLTPGLAQAQTASPASADIQRERVEQLTELLRTKKDLQASQQAMQQQLAEFDARIAALEASFGATRSSRRYWGSITPTAREDAQEQPGVNAFENSQIRLSDGTLLFGPDPFNTGGNINKATYQMLDLDAGLKWRGWSLEAEYYFRWVDDFQVSGNIPVTSLFDHGFQVYASTMLKPDYLQAYLSGSQIFGEYGDPWDLAVGLTYFPFGYKEVRMNAQALYMDRSAVGYTAVPYVVGGTGWVYTVDVGTWF